MNAETPVTGTWHRARPKTLKPIGHYVNTYAVIVPVGMDFEACLEPEFWCHVASRLQPHDEIVLAPEDGSYRAHLFVRSVGKVEARVAVVHKAEFDDVQPAAEADWNATHRVIHAGPHHKWRVERVVDDEILKHGFPSKAAAESFAREHAGMT